MLKTAVHEPSKRYRKRRLSLKCWLFAAFAMSLGLPGGGLASEDYPIKGSETDPGCLCGSSVGSLQIATPGCEEPGVKLITSRDNPFLDARTAVVTVRGPITPDMIDQVLRLGSPLEAYTTLIFDLDSPGGRLDHAEQLASIIRSFADKLRVKTYVRHGSRCLSGCILVFQQGEERIAGGSSSWLFHAACDQSSTLLLHKQTERFVDAMIAAGASKDFMDGLVERGYLTEFGEYWLSGYELFHVHRADIITELLDPWRPHKRDSDHPE